MQTFFFLPIFSIYTLVCERDKIGRPESAKKTGAKRCKFKIMQGISKTTIVL
jgi:hypothetical protein